MAFISKTYNVVIASPSDVNDERKELIKIIHEWNAVNSRARHIILLPLTWEENVYPEMADRPQEVINKQIIDDADILIGIFWTRIGTHTGKALSGTVEEIERHLHSNKPTMLYFSQKPVVPDNLDKKQYEAVIKFKRKYLSKGIIYTYNDIGQFRKMIMNHLTLKLNQTTFLEETTELREKNKTTDSRKEVIYDSDDGKLIIDYKNVEIIDLILQKDVNELTFINLPIMKTVLLNISTDESSNYPQNYYIDKIKDINNMDGVPPDYSLDKGELNRMWITKIGEGDIQVVGQGNVKRV